MLSEQSVKPLKAVLGLVTIILLGISAYSSFQEQLILSNYFLSGSILTGLLYIHIDNILHRVKTVNTLEKLHNKLNKEQTEENKNEKTGENK